MLIGLGRHTIASVECLDGDLDFELDVPRRSGEGGAHSDYARIHRALVLSRYIVHEVTKRWNAGGHRHYLATISIVPPDMEWPNTAPTPSPVGAEGEGTIPRTPL